MRHLMLLALVTLAAFPLSAHDHGCGPRRVVVVEAPRCAPRYRDELRWDDRHDYRYGTRYEHRAWYRQDDCEDRIVVYARPRPLVAPFEGRFELRLR